MHRAAALPVFVHVTSGMIGFAPPNRRKCFLPHVGMPATILGNIAQASFRVLGRDVIIIRKVLLFTVFDELM